MASGEIEAEDNPAVAKALANFLLELHSIPIQTVSAFAKEDELSRLDIRKRKPVLRGNADKLKEMGLFDTYRLEAYIEKLDSMVETVSEAMPRTNPLARTNPQAGETCLVHGDMHMGNLLFDSKGRVSAVIDFGDFHLGERACDPAIAYSLVKPDNRSLFYDIYGSVPERTKTLARFKAIFTNVYLLLHAHNTGNTGLEVKARQGLDNALDNTLA